MYARSRLFQDYLNPPDAWRGAKSGKTLPANTIEALVMGRLAANVGASRVNLKGSWFVIPFSRGVQTKFEGQWLRVSDPNREFVSFCWFASVFDKAGRFARRESANVLT